MRFLGLEIAWRPRASVSPPVAPPAPARRRHPRRRAFSGGASTRLTSDWTSTPTSIDQDIYQHQRILRARARDLAQNNDYGARFVAMVRNNVIGPQGIALQARIRDPNGTEDELANQAVERAWKDWGGRDRCDQGGLLHWAEMQRVVVANVAIDGEVLIRIHQGAAAAPYFYSLELLDPELLDTSLNKVLPDGGYIRLGIEYGPTKRRRAYHLFETPPGDSFYTIRQGNRVRIPASEIIHVFRVERAGQTRGVPWMSPPMLRLQMIGAFMEAAVTNARIGASDMGIIEQAEDSTGEPFVGDDTDTDGSPIIEVEPGVFRELPPGKKLSAWHPEYPKGEFGPFVKAALRGVSSGLGVSYPILANDLEGVNYSSIRAALLEDRDGWMTVQDMIIGAFCQPVYEAWLALQLALGTLTVPTSSGKPAALNPANELKYRQVDWQPRRWPWVDPLKDMQANALAIELGVESVGGVIRQSGREPSEVWEDIRKERPQLAALGINPPASTPAPSPPPSEDSNPKEDE